MRAEAAIPLRARIRLHRPKHAYPKRFMSACASAISGRSHTYLLSGRGLVRNFPVSERGLSPARARPGVRASLAPQFCELIL